MHRLLAFFQTVARRLRRDWPPGRHVSRLVVSVAAGDRRSGDRRTSSSSVPSLLVVLRADVDGRIGGRLLRAVRAGAKGRGSVPAQALQGAAHRLRAGRVPAVRAARDHRAVDAAAADAVQDFRPAGGHRRRAAGDVSRRARARPRIPVRRGGAARVSLRRPQAIEFIRHNLVQVSIWLAVVLVAGSVAFFWWRRRSAPPA